MASTRRNELILRLLAGRCQTCEDTVNLEVHRIRKLADLSKPGRREKPAWMHLRAMRGRKTLVRRQASLDDDPESLCPANHKKRVDLSDSG
jgi:hypothetical protein